MIILKLQLIDSDVKNKRHFDSRNSIFWEKLPYSIINGGTMEYEYFSEHYTKYNFYTDEYYNKINLNKPGQYFLMSRMIDNDNKEYKSSKLYYPILSIFYAVVENDYTSFSEDLRYFYYPRTWEKNYNFRDENFIGVPVNFLSEVIPNMELDDQYGNEATLIYGIWDNFPTWKELKRAYEKSWYYLKTRENVIDTILNERN